MANTGRVLNIVAVSVLLLALAGIYWRFSGRADTGGDVSAAEPGSVFSANDLLTHVAVPVVGAPAVRDTLIISVDAAGEAEAERAATLRSEVAGRVLSARLHEGQAVRAGQVLLRTDPTPYELAVRQAEAALAKAQARFTELTWLEAEVTDSTARGERVRLARALAGLVDAEIAVETSRLELERTTIRAPFDGYVAHLAVVPGQHIVPGDSICVIVDVSRLHVQVQALETEIVHLASGREAAVTFSALPETAYVGRVATISPVIDPGMRTARVTVRLADLDERIRPGMYARVRIAARLYPDRVLVRREAILERERRTLVFLFEPDAAHSDVGLAKWTYVTAGLENDEYVEIVPSPQTKMIEPGQVVLIEGHAALTHDARVRVRRE